MSAPSRLLPLLLLTMAACRKGEWVETTACMSVDDAATECPAADDVDESSLWVTEWCDDDVKSVEGEGTLHEGSGGDSGLSDTGFTGTRCCYPVVARNAEPGCMIGRPFRPHGEPLLAGTQGAQAQSRHAQAWLGAARMEHASVASFARLTLDLMAVGAPLPLLAQVQAAAVDEVEHARLTFEMASQLSGGDIEPGPLDFGGPIQPRTDLAAIAVDTVIEGCIGETMGAFLARDVAAHLPEGDPQRALLEQLAADEERHAALSWGIVAWLIQQGGEPVRQAVARAFQQPTEIGGVMALLAGERLPALLREGTDTVLEPAAEALLAA